MQTPSREDWGPVDRADLDAASAFDTFFGKSLDEARALFARNALFYQEELGSMPPIPFRFYVRAFVDYIESDDAAGDADGASCFLYLFDEMLSRFRGHLDPATETTMLETAQRIASRQQFYDADVDIYQYFAERLRKTEQMYMAPNNTRQHTRGSSSGEGGA